MSAGLYHSVMIWKKPVVIVGLHFPDDILHDPIWWTDDKEGFRHYQIVSFGFATSFMTASIAVYLGPIMLTLTWPKKEWR